jgi:glucokinase
VTGGVAVHILGALERPAFMQFFERNGRFAELMAGIPIHVVTSPAGLAAAAGGLENSLDSQLNQKVPSTLC